MFAITLLTLCLATLLSVVLLYLKFPLVFFNQMIALVIVILVLLNRFVFARYKIIPGSLFRVLLIFLVCFLMQLIIVSTGGFFSPLLIILHLSFLGFALFLSFSSALVFLVLTLLVLFFHFSVNANLYSSLFSDSSGTILYAASIIAVLPLTKYLVDNYKVKDTLAGLLNLSASTERSILESLDEQVFITDQNLNILFASSAVQNSLKLTDNNILGKNLLGVVDLRDENKTSATLESLLILAALEDKTARIINSFYLYNLKNHGHIKMTIQVNPVTDPQNKIKQLVIVLNPNYGDSRHLDLAQAQLMNLSRADQLKKILYLNNLSKFVPLVEVFSKTGQDIIYSLELEDHPIKNYPSSQDIVKLCQTVITKNTQFSNPFSIQIVFNNQIDNTSAPLPVLVNIDAKWYGILIQKLLDVAILLGSHKNSDVVLTTRQGQDKQLFIEIAVKSMPLSEKDIEQLFIKYYGYLSSGTNLKFGSGLEGYIIKTITGSLGVKLETEYKDGLSLLVFRVKLNNIH